MKMIDRRITFGVIVGTRGFFNPKLAQEGRAQLKVLGYNHVILPADATEHGAIETYAHAQNCAQLSESCRANIDGIIVVLPNFGDELGVVQTLDMAKLNVPVLVQACNDRLDEVDVFRRRDAFCGKISVCEVPGLRQLLAHICRNGYEHHVAMTRTHCAQVLEEALPKYLGWDLYRHK